MSDFLPTPSARLSHEIEVRKLRLPTLVTGVSTSAGAREVVNERKAAMPGVCHHCTAFVVSTDDAQPVSHPSDGGEPSGAARRPMFDVLAGSKLVDVVAVVTRYFGGTLLGMGGSVRIHSDSARECLEGVPVVVRNRVPAWPMALPHADVGRCLSELVGIGASVEPEYEAGGVHVVIARPNADVIASPLARLSSGSTRLEPERTRTVEVPADAIRSDSAKR